MNRLRRCFADRRGLVNTTDLVVASGATLILAAGVAAASLAGIDQAKLGKAQPDAQAIASAMQAFFKDTGKWPGQAEVAASDGSNVKQARMLTTNRDGTLPAFGTLTTIKTDTASCGANSLEGFASGSVQIFVRTAGRRRDGELRGSGLAERERLPRAQAGCEQVPQLARAVPADRDHGRPVRARLDHQHDAAVLRRGRRRRHELHGHVDGGQPRLRVDRHGGLQPDADDGAEEHEAGRRWRRRRRESRQADEEFANLRLLGGDAAD